MKPGEHYILFLTNEIQPNLSDLASIPRYAITGVWAGLFKVDESGVKLSSGASDELREQFSARNSQDVITEIRLCSQTPTP